VLGDSRPDVLRCACGILNRVRRDLVSVGRRCLWRAATVTSAA
jgi:hypothetical protein